MSAQLSQLAFEATLSVLNRRSLLSQLSVEIALNTTDRRSLISQLPVEVLLTDRNNSNLLFSQLAVEVMSRYTPPIPSTGRILGPALQCV